MKKTNFIIFAVIIFVAIVVIVSLSYFLVGEFGGEGNQNIVQNNSSNETDLGEVRKRVLKKINGYDIGGKRIYFKGNNAYRYDMYIRGIDQDVLLKRDLELDGMIQTDFLKTSETNIVIFRTNFGDAGGGGISHYYIDIEKNKIEIVLGDYYYSEGDGSTLIFEREKEEETRINFLFNKKECFLGMSMEKVKELQIKDSLLLKGIKIGDQEYNIFKKGVKIDCVARSGNITMNPLPIMRMRPIDKDFGKIFIEIQNLGENIEKNISYDLDEKEIDFEKGEEDDVINY